MWTKRIKFGDFVGVINVDEKLSEERILQVTKITKNSIFVDKMQFSKYTGIQFNMKRKLVPILVNQHTNK
jgi:hypothetical protein